MSSRLRATTAFVASLVLLVVSLALWVASRGQGVGTNLERVTLAPASVAVGGSSGSDVAKSNKSSLPETTPTRAKLANVPVVDATKIEVPDEVQPPREVRIAKVGNAMPISATGVTSDGQMELPDDPRTIGWYRFGALPGDARGSAVLGGHVDSERHGTGPLARLASARDGDPITVTAADGQQIRYEVTSVKRITKAALPVDRLFAPDVAHRLVIVTCGGRYFPDAGGYEDNIVVIATPAS